MSDLRWSCSLIYSVLTSLQCYEYSRTRDQGILDSSLLQLELVFREILLKGHLDGLSEDESVDCDLVRRALEILRSLEVKFNSTIVTPAPLLNPSVGRPRFNIPKPQLEYLVENNFTPQQMADIIGVSVQTVHSKLADFEISLSSKYSNLTDDELDKIVSGVQKDHPMCGNRQIQGHLFSLGLRVQQSRVKESQRRIDPHGSIVHRLYAINRRSYKVRAPRSLYHIDGNHKLIRWRLVIHGCIDGYSRRIIYLKCSNNNKAETVFEAFIDGVQRLGLPERVRGDRGDENIQVAAFMLEHPMRGTRRGSFIRGQSVHNQRIEQLWRDVFNLCTVLFYQLFYYMENNGIFSIDNETQIFCLHYVYIPRINESLQQFLHAWNNHPMPSEANLTPTQLWITGLARYQNQPIEELSEEDLVNYGVDWNGPLPSDEEVQGVTVPDTVIPLVGDVYDVLHENVDPLAYSRNYGIDLYLKALQYLL